MDMTFDGDTVTIAIPERGIPEIVAHFAIESIATPTHVIVRGHALLPDRRQELNFEFAGLQEWEVAKHKEWLIGPPGAPRDGLRTALAALTWAVDVWATPTRLADARAALRTPYDDMLRDLYMSDGDETMPARLDGGVWCGDDLHR